MRIAQLIETDGPGGAEQMLLTLSRLLREMGHSVVALLPDGRNGWLTRALTHADVDVEHYRLRHALSWGCLRRITAVLRDRHVDVAHSHEFSMAVYGAAAARLAGAAHVITMHGSAYGVERFRRRLAMRLAASLSGTVAAVSEPLAERLRGALHLSRRNSVVVPNGIVPFPPAACIPQRSALTRWRLGLEPEDRLVVAVGNLYPVKGHAVLLDAVSRLTDAHPRLHVAIAGRGALAAELEARARALDLAGRVHVLGLRDDVGDLLAAADIFALPSLSEGLPIALLEAMFAGRPIVATDVGDVAHALANGSAGLVVPPGNAAALALAIDTLLRDAPRAERLSATAARRAAAEYHADRMTARYLALYARALHARGALAG